MNDGGWSVHVCMHIRTIRCLELRLWKSAKYNKIKSAPLLYIHKMWSNNWKFPYGKWGRRNQNSISMKEKERVPSGVVFIIGTCDTVFVFWECMCMCVCDWVWVWARVCVSMCVYVWMCVWAGLIQTFPVWADPKAVWARLPPVPALCLQTNKQNHSYEYLWSL